MKANSGSNADLPVTLRPDWFAFAFFGTLTFLLWFPGLAEMYRGLGHASRDLAVGVCASILVFLLLYFWNIEIGENGITYRRLLFQKSFMSYSSMEKATIETSRLSLNFGPGGPFRLNKRRRAGNKPIYCLLLLPHSKDTPPLMINIKPFSRSGLSFLIHTISQKAPHVQLDAACERIKNKIMPSVFFPTRGQ